MIKHWVLNASPLMGLSNAGYAGLLLDLADKIVLPRDVADEIEARPVQDPARIFLDTRQLPVVDTPLPPAEIIAWNLGAGETAVLTYALSKPGWIAIVDDGVARKCAPSLSIPLRELLSFIL